MTTISDMTDAELSEAVAEEVWGWKLDKSLGGCWVIDERNRSHVFSANDPRETLRLLEWMCGKVVSVQIEQVMLWVVRVEGDERCIAYANTATLHRSIAEAALHVAREAKR